MGDAPLYALGLWVLAIPQYVAVGMTGSDVLEITTAACLLVAIFLLLGWVIGVGAGWIKG